MIPFILHMATRIGLKIISLILQDGLSNAKGGLLQSTSGINNRYKKEDLHKSSLNVLMKKTILGNDTNKFQFDLPLEKDPSGHSRRQGIINFKNTKV